jgi:hypothetical protein
LGGWTLRSRFGAVKSRLIALNGHDAVMQITEGSCDLLSAYHHPSHRCSSTPTLRDVETSGRRRWPTYSQADADGLRCSCCRPRTGEKVPFLSYASAPTWAGCFETDRQAGRRRR